MDISNYQGKISVANFKKAKKAGIKFVILKLGYTGYEKYICKLDSAFENNYKNAIAAGLPVGIYYYSLGKSYKHGKEEAEFCIKHLKGKEIQWPVYIDVEDSKYRQKNATKTELAECCNGFCDTMAKAGYVPGVYASTSWFNSKIGNIKSDHTKWVAQYYKICQYKGKYDIWQYSSTEGVPGISSKTDVNWAYKNLGKSDSTIIIPEEKKNVKLVAYDGAYPKLPLRGYFNRGDNSKEVEKLQLFLNWYGDYELVIEGVVGTKTIDAVSSFQKDMGLAVDGLFGKKCLAAAKAYKKEVPVEEEKESATPVETPAKPIKADEAYTYQGKFPSLTITKTRQEVIDDACAWGKMIAADNRFHYGHTSKDGKINAHHNGCYFCKTQGSNKNGIVDKEFSQCCNPFVHSCWAHGGQIPKALSICKSGSSWDFNKGHGYDKTDLFKNLGHPKYENLEKGDVLCNDHHVRLYIGNGKIVEASGSDDNKRNSKKWNKSISVKKMSKFNYKKYPRVHRLKDGVKFTKAFEYGDLNDEVKKLQKFLNWYGGYGLTIDGKFMDKTLKAVKDFQKKEGLKVDGKFGETSLKKAKTVKKN